MFLGDSHHRWIALEKYFPGKPYVDRSIAVERQPGKCSSGPMHADVIRPAPPAAFILLAGTNDIAGDTGLKTLKIIKDNFRAM